jgi:hypothetical protein
MRRQSVVHLIAALAPDLSSLGAFIACALIAWGGSLQAWAFSDGTLPKPYLHDLLAPLPLWEAWMALLVPLALVVSPLSALGLDPFTAPSWLFAATNALYFYALSRCLVLGTRRFSRPGQPSIG